MFLGKISEMCKLYLRISLINLIFTNKFYKKSFLY